MTRNYRLSKSNWRLHNIKTGETADVDITIHERSGGKFMKIWQGREWEKRIEILQGNSVKLLLHLVSIAVFQNIIPSPNQLALLNWKRPNIYRAYRELQKADFIYQRDGAYYLSPYFCWKGNEQQLEQATQQLTDNSLKILQLEGEG